VNVNETIDRVKQQEESKRLRTLGRLVMDYSYESGSLLVFTPTYTMRFVNDPTAQNSHLVVRNADSEIEAYSHYANVEDVGRDFEEFLEDYFPPDTVALTLLSLSEFDM
jgi:glutamate/tyrosine decarboxylase-like PLP-dependent enzyme